MTIIVNVNQRFRRIISRKTQFGYEWAKQGEEIGEKEEKWQPGQLAGDARRHKRARVGQGAFDVHCAAGDNRGHVHRPF